MPFLGGPPLHPMILEIVAAFLVGVVFGLFLALVLIPAIVDVWAGAQRHSTIRRDR